MLDPFALGARICNLGLATGLAFGSQCDRSNELYRATLESKVFSGVKD
jgi:hypothetical protein